MKYIGTFIGVYLHIYWKLPVYLLEYTCMSTEVHMHVY